MIETKKVNITNSNSSIEAILNAKSLAVVGVSSDPAKFGNMTLKSIIDGGYKGRLYAIHPKEDKVLGIRTHKNLVDVRDPIDAVVIIVPARLVPDILRQAGRKKVKGAIILSAGFRESGRKDLETLSLEIAQKHGMRLMGPNIQGINYLPNSMCAMFFPVITTRGPLSIISQSGSITTVLSEWAASEKLGITAAVNLGNQTDLCEADYIDYFVQEKNTKVIVMYLESIKNGRRFLHSLKQGICRKPITILKSGRTPGGARAAASHTGSVAGNHDFFSTACRQHGVSLADNLENLYDQAKALATLGRLKGSRVAIVSSSGGANAIAMDAAEISGLQIPNFPVKAIEMLNGYGFLPLAQLDNPMDLATLDGRHYREAAMVIYKHNIADVILMNFADPIQHAVDIINDLRVMINIPIAVSFMGGGETENKSRTVLHQMGIPVFPTPERALRGIAASVFTGRHHQRRRVI